MVPPPLPLPLPSSFPLHGTLVAALSFIFYLSIRDSFTHTPFVLIQCKPHNQHEQWFPFRHSFILSFIHPASCHSQLTLTQHSAAGLRNRQQLPYCQLHHHTPSLHGSVPTITVTHDAHIACNKQLPTLIRLYRHSNQHCKYYIQGPPQPCTFLFHY